MKSKLALIIFINVWYCFHGDAECSKEAKKAKKRSPKVYLTVSPFTEFHIFNPTHQRAIIINYYDVDCKRLKMAFPVIGLFDHDPQFGIENALVLRKPFECPQGSFETEFELPKLEFDKGDNVSQCLGCWGAYMEAGKLVHSACLSTHPDWMYNMRDVIKNRTLDCLMIPGTHDSGCYQQAEPYRLSIYDKYVYTQEESVFNQLVYGIRYLDLRIWHEGAYRWKSRMFITHDRFHLDLPQLEKVLRLVKDFVEATNEIVIVDFHRKVTGFFTTMDLQDWQHREVIELVKEVFGDLLIGKKYQHETLETMWEMNKRILVTYYGYNETNKDEAVTSNVRHWWIDTVDMDVLQGFLSKNTCLVGRTEMFASNAILTPNLRMLVMGVEFSRSRCP